MILMHKLQHFNDQNIYSALSKESHTQTIQCWNKIAFMPNIYFIRMIHSNSVYHYDKIKSK